MKILIFVITLLPALGYANNLSWSKKWVNTLHNKSLSEVCKIVSKRTRALCASSSKSMMQDKSKFKLVLNSSDAISITYKKFSAQIRRTDDLQVYMINRRTLYISEIPNFKQLPKNISKLLDQSMTASNASLWLSAAYAENPPATEVSLLMAILILTQREQEICESAEKAVKLCRPFDQKLLDDLKKLKKDDPEVFLAKLNSQKTTRQAEDLILQASYFSSLFTRVDDSRLNALTKCQCQKGLCQLQEKKTPLEKGYDNCKKNVKALKPLLNKVANVGEHIQNLLDEVSQLGSKKILTGGPAPFKEDSYQP